MRCDEVRESVEELRGEAPPAPMREHLVSCAACAAYAREWRLVEAGLRALAREPVPAREALPRPAATPLRRPRRPRNSQGARAWEQGEPRLSTLQHSLGPRRI